MIRISALGWFPGAIFFPLGIDLFAEGSISASVYLHFFLSIAISGMIATIYSFFGMQFLTLRVIYPELWRSGRRPEVDAESKSPLTNTQQRIQLFQMGAGMIPLLCAVVLIWTKPRQSFGEAAGNVYNAVHVGMILLGMAGFWLLRGVGDRLNESSREIMQWEMPHPHPR